MSDVARARARTRQFLVAALCLLVVGLVVPQASAVAGPKVVVVVGPVGRVNADYRQQARLVVAEARRYTTNVVLVQSPRATWRKVKAAAQGASVLVYFGHGNGYPSRYGRFRGETKNGMGLDPASGADGWRHVNYGEDRIRASIRLAPDAAVLLYRLCYASGNTEPRLSEGTTSQSRQRVDGYGAGFLDAGAGVVFADGHPKSAANYMRQLFTTDRTMLQVFRSAPNFHHHVLGPYTSVRTPGARYALDPDKGGRDPSGFYRSVVGNMELTTLAVTQRLPAESPTPSVDPSAPADSPSPSPPDEPTASPTDGAPVEPSPSPEPTAVPTEPPTAAPPVPTASPTEVPTEPPTAAPVPTEPPTPVPPTPVPTEAPDPTPSPSEPAP